MNTFLVKLVLSGISYELQTEDGLIAFTYDRGEPVLLTPCETQLLSIALMTAIEEAKEKSK